MTCSYPNPWEFSNQDKNLISPNGQYRIEYEELEEIAMAGPLVGKCYLIYPDKTRVKLSDRGGGPAVWETQSGKFAFPIWTRGRDQKIAVVDIESQTLSIYWADFRVLDLKTFDKDIIQGQDSPMHKTTAVRFDISKRRVEEVNKLI